MKTEDKKNLKGAIIEALADRRLTPEILACVLGVLESITDVTTNMSDINLEEEYDSGRAAGAILPGGVDFDLQGNNVFGP